MILSLEELQDYIRPMVMATLEGTHDVDQRGDMLTQAMIDLFKQDREAHRRESLKV